MQDECPQLSGTEHAVQAYLSIYIGVGMIAALGVLRRCKGVGEQVSDGDSGAAAEKLKGWRERQRGKGWVNGGCKRGGRCTSGRVWERGQEREERERVRERGEGGRKGE